MGLFCNFYELINVAKFLGNLLAVFKGHSGLKSTLEASFLQVLLDFFSVWLMEVCESIFKSVLFSFVFHAFRQ